MRVILWAMLCTFLAVTAQAQVAQLDPDASRIREGWIGGIEVTLGLSQPVPWRARVLADPPRLVLDFRNLDLGKVLPGHGRRITSIRQGTVRPGWSRMVLTLARPHIISSAEMRTGDGATVHVVLEGADEAEFAAAAARPEPPEWALPAVPPAPEVSGEGPLLVMLDPGHGGLDPGAEHGGLHEKVLTLAFANELRQVLLRDGTFRVALTREDDRFVPLETRLTLARQAGAGVFISIHADAVAEGEATGTTIYTLSDEATDRAARVLAEWHDREDIIAGVDLGGQDDSIARVLMDMARAETKPRTDRLAAALEVAVKSHRIVMHRHPRQAADFAVLKAPDMPSVLIELGFLSSQGDLAKLRDPAWRARMALAVRDGLLAWAAKDAVIRPGLRR
ncbi:N-acetylmuramoyl-L-alanine amidase [Falsirhodobacter deserti]|uniref:N-acetylmuramoyl-L-alanine amidase n=1 Tax=Falsirhodobacter deserti TaxID=1365611 RepID=UPI000FE426E6|nr:N-acetylmuramoyl-L-alanine amidase [Falsirhodobacter deserti]